MQGLSEDQVQLAETLQRHLAIKERDWHRLKSDRHRRAPAPR